MEELYRKVTNIKPTETLSSISRVPMSMRRADKDHVYEPVVVSIGPFHRQPNNLALQPMQDCKIMCLQALMTRKQEDMHHSKEDHIDTTKSLTIDIWNQMQDLEAYARGCYSETIDISSEDFVTMMILDGCFIIELFYSYLLEGETCMNEKMKLNSRWMMWEVVMDLLKLENQLPWLVLQQLHKFFLPSDPDFTLVGITVNFLCFCLPQLSLMHLSCYNPNPCPDFPHLLALEQHLLGTLEDSVSVDIDEKEKVGGDKPREKCSLPSINDLLLSGISLKKKARGDGLRDVITYIEYNAKRATLEMPTLIVDSITVVLLRNMVAYEQCNIKAEPAVTSYVTFMDALVNSPEDVEALRIRGVVDHFLSSNEEVSELINNLTGGIDYNLNEGYLASISSQIQDHYNSKWSQRKVLWKRLMNTHEGITYLVTIVALYLTVLQTIFNLLSYFLPRS